MIDIFSLISLTLLSGANQIILPAPIDLIMLGMIKLGSNPFLIVIAVTFGSTLGAIVDYYLGRKGVEKISWLKLKTKSQGFHKAQRFYNKYGYWALLFSYAPFIGKYFVLVAGIMKAKLPKVLVFYIVGKLLYYAAAGVIILNIWR